MKIGYACISLGVNYKTNRRFILKNFTVDKFLETSRSNLLDLNKILKYNIDNRIYLFRISSDIIPFGSHEINTINWTKAFKDELLEIEKFIKNNSIRVSMHPGQYTVLNSPDQQTVIKSIKDIEYHCTFLDSLNVDYSCKIIIHVGGVYNNKQESLMRFKQNFKLLSSSSKKRLVIENDERSYNISDVLQLSDSIGIPVIFDNLHHNLNPSLSTNLTEILHKVSKTWSNLDGSMKLHYSDMAQNKKVGAHSDFVDTSNFIKFYNEVLSFSPDIMLEVKDKDLSAIKCINCVNSNFVDINKIWNKYKFTVLERSQSVYSNCIMVVDNGEVLKLYELIDEALALPVKKESLINALNLIDCYLEDVIMYKEKVLLKTLIAKGDFSKAKTLLHRLSAKYNISGLLNSYYFIY
ncbi:UV DNA damage repair endonuclease UvsE [Serpentinicella alkaliphila]|uniref:UV-damage endonuclease n=1 Tax=Serpentinicella alkaliphila TaxID=1734049 RepID=A0A4R2TFQ2_9FIRM|nr:UV DNA damage repair endonuclease UvsE [Serpentinicella alkaliphila]QUH27002.1 UV DNA damage repair endonuclease UvsE [Serpentinicella alkaliphila]TCQ01496.1 UV-damage endonuclease [Serpentinicella alkaliphila]